MIMQYEEQMAGMLRSGVEQAGSGDESAISAITQGAAQEILQNNQRMAEMGTVEDLERMTLELQRQQLDLEKEKLKLSSLQSAAKIAIDEEKLDLQRDDLEISAAEKLAKLRSGDTNKTKDRDDKFLIEVMKLLMKETGTSVEELKEKVDLTPQFAEGGDVQLSPELQNFVDTLLKEQQEQEIPYVPELEETYLPQEEEVKMDSDITRGPTLEEILPSELVNLVKENEEIPYVPELEETYLPQEQQEQEIPSEINWENILDKVAKIETGGEKDPLKAISTAGALGKYQIMPKTAKKPGYNVEPLKTPTGRYSRKDILETPEEEQRRFAGDYLKAMMKKFDDNLAQSLAAYNYGPTAIEKVLKDKTKKKRLPFETWNYLLKAMDQDLISKEDLFSNPYGIPPRKPERK
jgi:hypothetical protein